MQTWSKTCSGLTYPQVSIHLCPDVWCQHHVGAVDHELHPLIPSARPLSRPFVHVFNKWTTTGFREVTGGHLKCFSLLKRWLKKKKKPCFGLRHRQKLLLASLSILEVRKIFTWNLLNDEPSLRRRMVVVVPRDAFSMLSFLGKNTTCPKP